MVEQFAETSEVSTSLLGIPRAETQLSLFSDVSTYGRNLDEWEFFQFNGVFGQPAGWYNRKNLTYGNHFFTKITENIKLYFFTKDNDLDTLAIGATYKF